MQNTVGNSTTPRLRANNLATFSSGTETRPSTVPLSTRINGPVDGKNFVKYKVHVLATATYDTTPVPAVAYQTSQKRWALYLQAMKIARMVDVCTDCGPGPAH